MLKQSVIIKYNSNQYIPLAKDQSNILNVRLLANTFALTAKSKAGSKYANAQVEVNPAEIEISKNPTKTGYDEKQTFTITLNNRKKDKSYKIVFVRMHKLWLVAIKPTSFSKEEIQAVLEEFFSKKIVGSPQSCRPSFTPTISHSNGNTHSRQTAPPPRITSEWASLEQISNDGEYTNILSIEDMLTQCPYYKGAMKTAAAFNLLKQLPEDSYIIRQSPTDSRHYICALVDGKLEQLAIGQEDVKATWEEAMEVYFQKPNVQAKFKLHDAGEYVGFIMR